MSQSELPKPGSPHPAKSSPKGFITSALGWVERIGNKLPDPAALFVIALVVVWVCSAIFNGHEFSAPSSQGTTAMRVESQLTGTSFLNFLASMVTNFTGFHPLGVVLVAMLGVGVAEHTGFINAVLKGLIGMTPKMLLSPMLLIVAIVSHTAADAGYVLVIPLGGIIFHAAGRHPLAGIACAFAGVSGGFSANFIPSAIDPMLQGLSQSAAQILDGEKQVNVLCNIYFTAASSILVVAVGWFITDRIIEPRLSGTPIDGDGSVGDGEGEASMGNLEAKEVTAVWVALAAMIAGLAALTLWAWPSDSPLRDPEGKLTTNAAPISQTIVPLIFFLFLLPGTIYGYVAGTVKSHRDLIKGMSKSMQSMGYYLVMIFFCAQFTAAFTSSNLGSLLAVEGADLLKALGLPAQITIVGIIFLTAFVNLLMGSASGKWGLLAPIFVPILMQVGLSPELTQAAYRVGDSTTNIVTPLMPYFPLVVAFCQRWVKGTGIGTVTSLMLPYSVSLLVLWTVFLILYWLSGVPLGVDATYVYP